MKIRVFAVMFLLLGAVSLIAMESPALIQLGSKVDHEEWKRALLSRDIQKVEELLKLGADPNASLLIKERMVTPLFFALYPNTPANLIETSLLALLLQYKADPNWSFYPGELALSKLVHDLHIFSKFPSVYDLYKGHYLEVIQLLLVHGADPYHHIADKNSALVYARENKLEELVTLFEKTAWERAFSFGIGSLVKVEELLQKGADPNVLLKDDYLPLYSPVSGGWTMDALPVLKLLLDHGANPDVPLNETGITALMRGSLTLTHWDKNDHYIDTKIAVEKRSCVRAIIKLLLSYGADPLYNNNGQRSSALSIAQEYKHEELILLFKQDALKSNLS